MLNKVIALQNEKFELEKEAAKLGYILNPKRSIKNPTQPVPPSKDLSLIQLGAIAGVLNESIENLKSMIEFRKKLIEERKLR